MTELELLENVYCIRYYLSCYLLKIFFSVRKEMDKTIYNVPKDEFLTLRFLFPKEEEEYCKISRTFS